MPLHDLPSRRPSETLFRAGAATVWTSFVGLLAVLSSLVLAPRPVEAQGILPRREVRCTTRRPRVEKLEIDGNSSITDADLRSIMFTERAGRLRRWFGWNVGTAACMDSLELTRDARRITTWYALRGYPGTQASASYRASGERTVHVRFVVREAPPVRIDSLYLVGLPARVVNQRDLTEALRGAPLDDSILVATVDSVQQLLRAAGYARAAPPNRSTRVDTAARRARVTLEFHPGAQMRIGEIEVDLTANDPADPALNARSIRDLLRFKPGDVYDPRAISASQQLLFSYDLYRTVAIDTLSLRSRGDTIPVRVRLTEGRHSWVRTGAGWGTIDCFRTQTRYVRQNFLGRGHRFQLDARLSKIGVGDPLDNYKNACAPRVIADSFSARLNYYIGTSVLLRGPLGDKWHPQATLYSERRTEFQSYIRETTIGGLASFDRPIVPRVNTTFTYRFDAGRTYSDQAVACATFGLCRFNDRTLLLSPSVTHAAGMTWSRSAPAISSFPINDGRWAIESRLGTVHIGDPARTVNFNRTQLEYAIYRPLTAGLIGAIRVSGGVVATRRELEPLVPPQERFYSGGQNTVRGYNQGQLGPTVYIVGSITDSVLVGGDYIGVADAARGFSRQAPAGGTANALLNIELRSRNGWPIDQLRWVLFLDAGRVWNNSGNYAVTGLRATPGLGVRLVTPLGPFRVDIGYNPHLPEIGPAFLLRSATAGQPGRAICVSAGSTEPLDPVAADALGPASCPATFQPPRARGLFPRLTFHFSIGEAF
jgi:outer membrane protein insertion porin family/translocation and assembly module TamA